MKLAADALAAAFGAGELVVESYWQQRLASRRTKSAHLPTLLGCSLGHGRPEPQWQPLFSGAFNAAVVPVEWRVVEPVAGEHRWDVFDEQVEWCLHHGLVPIAGPLVDLALCGLPPWLKQWQNDVLNMQSFVCDFVETAVSRYVGRVRQWEICAHANTGGVLGLDEEQRLALTARTLETAAQVDDETQLMVCIEQPWGEYQAAGEHRLAPWQFIDALVRSAAPLHAVNIEINIGFRPRGCAARDLLDISRLIDLWSRLGLPLHVTLAFPSRGGPDAHAAADLQVAGNGWKRPWSEQTQAEWVASSIPLLMAKESVVGIYWSHFSDSVGHRFPHAGLITADGRAKPALQQLIRYRGEYFGEEGHAAAPDPHAP